ncbi:type II toxin-antitoxin system TacA family antitoxin [Rhodoblastus sp.]|uniref:type II toxin-antitoxin system TacA family antitoxin n=1 Tax=Rhodoblastus sp. TaxID=1962975 RepID=UPI003F9E69BB
MSPRNSQTAEVNIHLRARETDRALIDRAAELVGANRSQFMLASAIKEAKNVLLDQSTIYPSARAFQQVMDWMDAEPAPSEAAGMKRILQAKTPWRGE